MSVETVQEPLAGVEAVQQLIRLDGGERVIDDPRDQLRQLPGDLWLYLGTSHMVSAFVRVG